MPPSPGFRSDENYSLLWGGKGKERKKTEGRGKGKKMEVRTFPNGWEKSGLSLGIGEKGTEILAINILYSRNRGKGRIGGKKFKRDSHNNGLKHRINATARSVSRGQAKAKEQKSQ